MGKYDLNFIYDEPVVYKTLKIYPPTMREYLQFFTTAPVLLLDKNSIPDIKILSMSYLEYLYTASDDDNYYLALLDGLLRLILKTPTATKTRYSFDNFGKPFFMIGEDVFDRSDFDEIRKIIIEQNLLVPPNDKIDKRLRDSMDEAKRLRRKLSGNSGKTASLEDQMVAVMISIGVTMDDIFSMSIRKFIKALERIDHKLHYEIYLSASLSGLVTFKDKSAIKHWLSELKTDEFDGLIDYRSVESKISSAKS